MVMNNLIFLMLGLVAATCRGTGRGVVRHLVAPHLGRVVRRSKSGEIEIQRRSPV